ncbi:MAG: PEP/pyruvate-binding domain-containing protein [Candidatus Cloacimonetes bacterium]|nr:PEP/pyruvate-binding domain-containing protein [Candidatus Cloacimonadota bacterium]
MQICEIHNHKDIDSKIFGGKAAGLVLLHKLGYHIPKTIFIESCRDTAFIYCPKFLEELSSKLKDLVFNGRYNVAVRSSCTIEDSFSESMAGYYDTFIGEMTFDDVVESIKKVIYSLAINKDNDAKMGVIIQEKINADYSGVLFSSDPYTYSKKSMLVSFTSGICQGLVSGKVSGEDIVISVKDDNFTIPKIEQPIKIDCLQTLLRQSKSLEKELKYPVNIEWAIANNTIYFLQCRPLTSITKLQNLFLEVNEENLSELPINLVSHEKIKMRLEAQKLGVMISNAYVSINNHFSIDNTKPPVQLERSEHCKGYSTVIIYPRRILNKVVRSFIGDKTKIKKSSTSFMYVIQASPHYENLNDCLQSFSSLIANDFWVSTTIIQEILDPTYTGAIRKLPNGYLVEIIRGHFFSKGVFPASQYFTNDEGCVISKNEVHQKTWLSIIEGHVLNCSCNDNENNLVYLSNANIKKIIKCFMQIFASKKSVVEFGVLQHNLHEIIPYLIDSFDDTVSSNEMSITDINEGIISSGKITGKIMYLKTNETDSLNKHFHDLSPNKNKKKESVVFFCDTPAIALLSLLEQFDSEQIGFVFFEGSFLCHFASILREKRIPAIRIDALKAMPYEGMCTIDAETKNLLAKDRIIKFDL